MKKEWFATKELLGVAGLPTTRQGVNKQANVKGWARRKLKGVQGKGVEYSLWSLPDNVRHALQESYPAYSVMNDSEQLSIWVETFKQLSAAEREHLIDLILREGAIPLLACLNSRPKGMMK
ncbi:DNA-binding protein [Musicola keenii]|uniref:DNA-binding protein n=1 Tax=Musicola keenii TaxID=2884250 RepID=UPI00178379F9|nr:DNA-binding protein [Musicola keenii]